MSPKSWEAHAARIAREQLLKEAEEAMEIIGDAGTELAAVKIHHAALEYKAYQEGLFISLDEPDMEPEELEEIAEDMATIDPMDLFKKESVNQTMKSFHLERDAAELKGDQKHGAA